MHLRIRSGCHENLRQVVLRFNQIEFRLVRGEVVVNVLVGHRDLGRHFLVHHLVHRDRAADVALEIFQANLFFLQSLIKLLLRVRGLDLVEFSVYFLLGGEQAELFGSAHYHFVVDQLAKNVQAENGSLFPGGGLLGAGHLIVVVLVDVGTEDLAAIDCGHHVAAYL